jgi:hypothetical protein
MQNPPEPPNELKLSHIELTKNSSYAYQCIGRGGRKTRGFYHQIRRTGEYCTFRV